MATTDVLMDLADGVAAAIGEREDLPKGTRVEVPEDATVQLHDRELRNLLVWVVEMGEKVHEVDGQMVEDLDVLIVLQKKLDGRPEALPIIQQVRGLSAVASTLARSLVNVAIDCGSDEAGAAVCIGFERTRPRDMQDLATNNRFYAEILTHWRRGAD